MLVFCPPSLLKYLLFFLVLTLIPLGFLGHYFIICTKEVVLPLPFQCLNFQLPIWYVLSLIFIFLFEWLMMRHRLLVCYNLLPSPLLQSARFTHLHCLLSSCDCSSPVRCWPAGFCFKLCPLGNTGLDGMFCCFRI